jgi:hypothetical protein
MTRRTVLLPLVSPICSPIMNLPPLSPGFELGLPALAGYTRSGTCTLFFVVMNPFFRNFQ